MRHPWDQRLGFWWIAEDRPGQPCVVESPSGLTATFGELAGRAHQIVHALRARGLGAGDIVAYALPNDVDMLWWQYALQESGMHAIALNPSLSAGEIRSVVEHSGAAAIVVDHGYAQAPALAAASTAGVRVAVGGAIDGFEAYADLVHGHPTTPPAERSFGTPISYSSGTTGKPKAIARPAPAGDPSALADQAKLFGRAFQFLPFDGAHLVAAGMHHGGCQSFYQGALTVGQAVAIMGKFDPERTLRMIEQHGRHHHLHGPRC